MWSYLLLIVLALLVIKLVTISLYWSKRGLTYESFPRYLYRTLWLFNTRVIYEVIREDVEKYGRVYGTYSSGSPCLVVADAEIAKDVLIKQFGTFFKRTFEFTTGDPLWDNTVTHLPYEQWKSVRTVMGYTFTSSKMKGMIPKVDQIASRYSEKLASISESDENEITLGQFLYGFSLDSVVAVSFGIDINTLDNPNNEFVKTGGQIFKPTPSTVLAFLFPKFYRFIPFIEFPPKKTMKFFSDVGKQIIGEKRKNLDEVIQNGTADILDLHLIAQKEDPKNHLTDEILASQAFLFFFGGTDTTAVTLRLCTYLLATNPDVQQRVVEEIKDVLGERTDIQYEDVQKMKLLEASLLESLRIVPSIFVIDRIAAEDTEVAGIPVEKGTVIEFPLSYIHHDPKYFPEPEKFLPDRFLKNGDISSETAAFLSFGDGPKSCIGRRLVLMNMQILLARILSRVQLEACSKTPVPLRLKPGFKFTDPFLEPLVLRLTPRE